MNRHHQLFTPEIGELQPNNSTISGAKYIYNKYKLRDRFLKKRGRPASVKLCVVIADRHGEFTTHQPSPTVCLVVICVGVKMKRNEF